MTREVTVVRPYGDRVRQRVFALLEKAGLSIRDQNIIPPGTSDDEVVAILRNRTTEVLLVPFHLHHDEMGKAVNGLDLLCRLVDEVPSVGGVPVLMPASFAAVAGARLRLLPHVARPLPEAVRTAVLLLDESELEDPSLLEAVVRHAHP